MAVIQSGPQANRALAQRLGIEIVTGRRLPGTILPGELDLADQFGVARSVVREALQILAGKGLVDSKRKAGTRVRERSIWNLLDPELLGWMFEGAPSLRFVRNLFQLRLIVEPAAAELAAANRTEHQLSELEAALAAMTSYGLAHDAGRVADEKFHAIIIDATHNELLASLSASIAAAVRWTTILKYRGTEYPRDPIPAHRRLFEAIANGDRLDALAATKALVVQAQADTEAAIARMSDPLAADGPSLAD